MANKTTIYEDYDWPENKGLYLEGIGQLGLYYTWGYTCNVGDYNKLILNTTIGFLDTGLEDGYESVSGWEVY